MPNAAHARRYNLAVVNRRTEPADSLDYFPTPPWATRALFECVLFQSTFGTGIGDACSVWEPACGEGHMAAVLAEYFGDVRASDVHDYGFGKLNDFLAGHPLEALYGVVDWVITNPPYNEAESFFHRARGHARHGIALLMRTQWRHTQDRFRDTLAKYPPVMIADFVERVKIVKGRWEPQGSTATDYSWFIWSRDQRTGEWQRPGVRSFWGGASYQGVWIPPGQKNRLTRKDDYDRFGAVRDAPLLEGV